MYLSKKVACWAGGCMLLVIGIWPQTALAQRDNNNNYIDSLQAWSLHFQSTAIVQGHGQFTGGGYDGRNTLSAQSDTALSVTTTLFVGRRLWRGANLYLGFFFQMGGFIR